MSVARLALRNTRRQPRRSILTALAVALAVAAATFFDAYMAGAMDSFFDAFVRLEAGHVKVLPAAAVDRVRRLPLDEGLAELDSLMRVIRGTPGVAQASARVRFGVLLEGPEGAVPALGTAVVPSHEQGLLELEEWLVEGRVPRDGADEALVGYRLAEELGLKLGDELFFVATTSYGGLGPGVYTITGLSKSGMGTLDRNTFLVPLAPAQYQLATENMAQEIVILAEGGLDAANALAVELQRRLDAAGFRTVRALTWQQQGVIFEMMGSMKVFEFVLMGLLGVIALTTVINTVLMSVMERTREIGALRALGFGRATVVRMVLLESLFVGVVGTVVGLAVGLGLSFWLHNVGIDLSSALENMEVPIDPVIYPRPDIAIALKAAAFGVIVAALAAWYPARVAARLEPARALRAQ